MKRARDLAESVVIAAQHVRREPPSVAFLIDAAREAAGMLRDRADLLDSYDVGYVRTTLYRMARERKGGQKALAGDLGVSASYLSDIIVGRREPGEKILDAIGLERVSIYRDKVMP